MPRRSRVSQPQSQPGGRQPGAKASAQPSLPKGQSSALLWLLTWVAIASLPAQAQVVPDNTLGNGNNSVTNTINNRTDITGGLRRSSSLFHSFERFNVITNHQVYFANPTGIQNIFSRVTGGSLSSIDGTLGVAGAANLFFINPNGIIFGPNARLDVSGSFFATTADALVFPDSQRFAARGDRAVPLVEVNIPIGLQYGANPPAMLTNRGTLATGQDLTLAAGNLDLQGQIQAGRDLTLQATDTVRIRDTVAEPFRARSGRDMVIQGNQSVDILALNHLSQTPFVSGSNISLISDGLISTDAHFTGGGNFSIRTLQGDIGNFVSLYDPIINMEGDFNVGNYTGASLQVNAGGNIAYGNVTINAIDAAVDAFRPAFVLNAGGNITANGDVATTVPGGLLRVDFEAVGDITLSSADPNVTRIIQATTNDPNSFSIIRLNSTAGSVILNRAVLSASNSNPATTGGAGAGDIFIRAAQNIDITESAIENEGSFGRIFIGRANSFETPVGERVTIDRSFLTATNSLGGTGGLIDINIPGNATTPGTITVTNSSLQTASANQAQGGEINLTAGNAGSAGSIDISGSFLDASISDQGGTGSRNPGVRMNAVDGSVTIRNNSLVTTAVNQGTTATAVAGPIEITAANVSVTGSSSLNATTAGAAPGGAIAINANSVTVNQSSQINTSVQNTGTAAGGSITIVTDAFDLDQGGRVQARTFGSGDAGDIALTFTNTATIANFDPQSQLYSGMFTDTLNSGVGGNITINSSANQVGELTLNNGGFLSARTASPGGIAAAGGNIEINVNNLNVLNGGQVLTTSSSFGNAGSITVNAAGSVTIAESRTAPSDPVSPFTNPTFTILSLDGLVPNTPTANPFVEQSDTMPFISLQRNPTGAAGRVFATPNASGDAVAGGTDIGAVNDFDYYGFTISQDGSRAIFDIDNNLSVPISNVDTELFLFDAQTGQLLASNDDFFPATAGSVSALDSRIAFNFNSAGRYVLGVGRFNTTASSGNPITGTPLAATDAYRLQVSLQNQGIGTADLSDRNPNQGLTSGLFSNTQPPVDIRIPGSGTGGAITVTAQTGQINLSDRGIINASTAGLGQGGSVLLQTGSGSVSVTGGARVETRTTGVGNVANFGGDAGNIVVNAPEITISGSTSVNGQPFYSGLLASSDTAKSGRGGAIIINNVSSGAAPGNRLLIENGAFLSTLNRSDQEGQGIEINVANLQLLDGGQVITAAEGLGRAGGVTINSPNVQIAGTNTGFVPPPPLPNGSGTLPWVSGGQTVDLAALSSTFEQAIDFSTTVPHVTIQGQGGTFDFYRLDSVNPGNRIVADIDNDLVTAGNRFDAEIFLFDSAGNLLTRNDDSRPEGNTRGSNNLPGQGNRDSYIDFTFTTPGTYFIGVGRFPSNPVPGSVALTGTPPLATDGYTLHLSVDQRNTLNPNQNASSGLFAQSTAVGGAAGNITVNGGGIGLLSLQNGAQISASTVSGAGDGITLQGLSSLQVTDSLISASTTGNGGSAGNVTINAANSVVLSGTLASSNSPVPAGLTTQATEGNGASGNISITTNQLTIQNGAAIAASTDSGIGGNIVLEELNTLQLNNGQIAASTGTGQAGNLTVNSGSTAADNITLSNSSSLSLAAPTPGGSGTAGNIFLNTQQLILQDNSSIAASTAGSGQAGDLTVSANGGTANSIALLSGSNLTLASTGSGNAGNVLLDTQQLNVSNSLISASTVSGIGGGISLQGLNTLQLNNGQIAAETGTGQAGNLTVNNNGTAAETITLSNSSSLSLAATTPGGPGTAGTIFLNTQQLTVQGNSSISASTAGNGQAGNLAVSANSGTANSVALLDGSNLSLASTGGGNAGNVLLDTQQLNVTDSLISASTVSGTGGGITLQGLNTLQLNNSQITAATGTGQAGNLTVNSNGIAAETIILNNGSALSLAAIDANGAGTAGNIFLNTQQLTVQANSSISASTAGSGQAGNLSVSANGETARSINLLDNSNLTLASTSSGNAGNVLLDTQQLNVSDSFISASTVSGTGGGITLQGLNSLQMNNGQITAATQSGQAGNVFVNASDSVRLDNSVLSVEAGAGGTAGNLTINAGNRLTLNNSQATVSSPAGQAGNLAVRTNDLRMNRGTLEAVAGEGAGANINIQVLQGLLLMRFNSLISADARNQANGGNITINAPFIIGLTFENSDIAADAVQGRGGNINITTNGIFGLQFRPRRTPLSDITASSQFGVSGNVVLRTLNIDATRGLSPPPIIFNDVSQVVGGVCEAVGAKPTQNSELRITGRGGVALSPTVPLPAQSPGSDWVSLEVIPQAPMEVTLRNGSTVTLEPGQTYQLQATCVQGWKEQVRSPL